MTSAEQEKIVGAQPAGARDEQAAATAVREMFSAIAPRYDLLNHLLSMNVDRLWWRRAARTFRHLLERPGARVLDLCCGTGDMGLAVRRQSPNPQIVGADFAHPMLRLAADKSLGKNFRVVEADALRLPLHDASFDLVVSAFGFRNLANYDAGLREIFRVLRPDGEVGILDFGEPRGVLGVLYGFYFRRVLPKVGTLISGVRGPYSYLPASVERFPDPQEMLGRMRAAGFQDASWTPYTFGIAGLYRGRK
ncbi:MAG: ubiquinone/menaquinone biosynthesis methyltransferase [Acidobacteriia bacterium]|nr:ubiquinone/menaquinone biosynthesis methyltransferase [Terriglobia bacterium]